MTEWSHYLSDDDLRDVRQAIIDAGLSTGPILDVISQSLHPLYRGNLPASGLPPNIRVSAELKAMNRVHNLRNGDVPLAQWLSAAIELAGDLPQADTLGKVLEAVNGDITAPPASATPLRSADELVLDERLEAQIGGFDQTLSISYLKRGIEAASSVVKLLVHRHIDGEPEFVAGGEPRLSNATGWIIGPNLLVTNHHVINARLTAFGEPNASAEEFRLQAEHTKVLYDYLELDVDAPTVDTGPGALLASNEALDFAVLRLGDRAPQRKPLRLRERHIRKTMNQALGERVNVLQHPNGDPMRLGFRDNFVVIGNAESLSYLTDTNSGSSGSPVCDDAWHVAALHSGSRGIGDMNITIRGRKIRRENFGTPIPRLMEKLMAEHPELHEEIVEAQP